MTCPMTHNWVAKQKLNFRRSEYRPIPLTLIWDLKQNKNKILPFTLILEDHILAMLHFPHFSLPYFLSASPSPPLIFLFHFYFISLFHFFPHHPPYILTQFFFFLSLSPVHLCEHGTIERIWDLEINRSKLQCQLFHLLCDLHSIT